MYIIVKYLYTSNPANRLDGFHKTCYNEGKQRKETIRMRWKPFLQKGLAILLCASFLHVPVPARAETRSPDAFHYGQLETNAARFYDGLLAMKEEGLLQTGTADYDLVANGHLTKEAAAGLLARPAELTQAMNAARYAFYADHPEVFYVDFPKLTYRTTKDADGTVHIYLGPGRRADYRLSGFSDEAAVNQAIQEFDDQVDALVRGAEAVTVRKGESKEAAQIRYVHNEIVNHAAYRMEDTCFEGDSSKPNNASFLGTPYGILVKKQGVCEGYSRAFKTVLDRLGIRSILVQGAHRYDEDVVVAHMWNYVALSDDARTNRWYAVDLTQDDPECFISAPSDRAEYLLRFDTYGLDGFENEKYLLAGASTMNSRHFVKEEVEAAGGYSFLYPDLETNDYMMKETLNNMDGFKVTQKTVPSSEGFDVTEYGVSYLGMNVTNARKQGIYFLARYYDFDENEAIVPVSPWGYLTDDYALKEDETSVYIQEGQVQYMEFAVTRVKPRDGLEGLTYQGDEFGLIARTGKLYNENQTDYVAPPYVKKQTPSQTATLTPNHGTYHVTASFTESLAAVEGEDLGCRIECKSTIGEAVSGAEQSTITNVTWDGDATVSFDITFSKMFADNSIGYDIYLTGLVGEVSRKIPNPIVFSVRTDLGCPSIMSLRGSWQVFGKPTLMEDADLSVGGWETADGTPVSEKLQDRLALVVSKPNATQEKQMEEALEATFPGDELVHSSTYNINLVVCKLMVISTGHKVRVQVGFPDGCGPNDAGTTYKAYHFKRDADGNVTGVEEIDCVVTPYGLVITCDAFSPFVVAAVKSEEPSAEKTILTSVTEGGTITGESSTKLSEGESASFTVTADSDYEIESITVCGKELSITDKQTMTFSVDYADVDANNLIQATFVHTSIVEKEEDRNETPVGPVATPITVTLPEQVSLQGPTTLTPTCSLASDAMQYQWYKNDQALEGETGPTLTVTEAGTYHVVVTVTVDAVTKTVTSNSCTVTPSVCVHPNPVIHPAEESTCTVPGHAAYTICNDCHSVLSGSDDPLPLLPHVFVETVNDTYVKEAATCTKPAVYVKSCDVCGMASDQTFTHGDALGHKTEVRGALAASCETDGYTGDTVCTVCEEVLTKGTILPKQNHTLKEVPGQEATHETGGVLAHYVCETCGKLFLDAEGSKETTCEDVIQSAKGHAYGDYTWDTTDHWKLCSCGQIAEKGVHEWADRVQDQYLQSEATCASGAIYVKSCKVCGAASAQTFQYGDPLAHTLSRKGEASATCEQNGYTGDLYCSVCGYKILGEVIPRTGHSLIKVPGREPSHEKAGIRAHEQCSVCGRTFPETITLPATGHAFEDYQTDANEHWKTCSCGEVDEKGEHTFSLWSVVTKPTETKAGKKTRTCTICDYTESFELPAYGRPNAVSRPETESTKETTKAVTETTASVRRPTATRPSQSLEEITESDAGTGWSATIRRPNGPSKEETTEESSEETESSAAKEPSKTAAKAAEEESSGNGGLLWLFVGIVMIAGASLAIFFVVRKQRQLKAEQDEYEE